MRRRLGRRGLWPCCRRSLACFLDTYLHALHISWARVCDRHDRRILGEVPSGEDWIEVLDTAQVMHHFDTLPQVEVTGPPKVIVRPGEGLFVDFTTGKVTPMPQTWGSSTSTVTYRLP